MRLCSIMIGCPRSFAAAGEPDIVEKLKKGHKAGDMTYKVHIDGFNLLPLPHRRSGQEPTPRDDLLLRRL